MGSCGIGVKRGRAGDSDIFGCKICESIICLCASYYCHVGLFLCNVFRNDQRSSTCIEIMKIIIVSLDFMKQHNLNYSKMLISVSLNLNH